MRVQPESYLRRNSEGRHGDNDPLEPECDSLLLHSFDGRAKAASATTTPAGLAGSEHSISTGYRPAGSR
jgi:hypothetical protein